MITNNQARKLGDIIREDLASDRKTSVQNLSLLQSYRQTYEVPASYVFGVLSNVSKRVRNDRTVTYRIKRLDSIISKIKREPNRELDRMWDIGGCRCILQSQTAVDKVYIELKKNFNIRREKNYTKEKKHDGYQGIHLYVDVPEEAGKVIEIQLRTIKQHNWATLVEIIDLVYDKKIKEGEKNTPFNKFHSILSDIDDATYEEKKEIIKIEKENKIFETLFRIFLRNYIDVRKNWLELEEKKGHNFFTILVDKDAKPTIKSFEFIEDAQKDYFESYLNMDANIVLTHLQDPSYKQISQAYSNYILTTHQFINDWYLIVKEIIFYAHKHKLTKDHKEFVKIFDEYFLIQRKSIQEEVNSIKQKIAETGINRSAIAYKKVQEWIDDLEQRVQFRSEINDDIKKLNLQRIRQEESFFGFLKNLFR